MASRLHSNDSSPGDEVGAIFFSDFDCTGFFRERKDVPGLGPHGADARRHGRRDYWVFDEEWLVASTWVGIATGRDMLRRPCFRPILREGSRDPSEGAGPLRGQERARRAGDRPFIGGVFEHPHPPGGVVALGTVD